MKIVCAVMVLLLVGVYGCSAQDSAAPESTREKEQAPEADPLTWDLGKVASGEEVSGTFTFTNETEKTFTVTSLTTSCGCTGSEIKDKILKPGQTTTVTVHFKSKGYKPGPAKQFIYINTDDSWHPVFRYTVTIEVVEKKS